MSSHPQPPEMYTRFVTRYPALGQAWELAGQASQDGPLARETALLVKLGIAAGTMRQGAVHSAVRKALAQGVSKEQVVALAASTLGFPSTVAIFSWVQDELEKQEG